MEECVCCGHGCDEWVEADFGIVCLECAHLEDGE